MYLHLPSKFKIYKMTITLRWLKRERLKTLTTMTTWKRGATSFFFLSFLNAIFFQEGATLTFLFWCHVNIYFFVENQSLFGNVLGWSWNINSTKTDLFHSVFWCFSWNLENCLRRLSTPIKQCWLFLSALVYKCDVHIQ